MTDRIDLLGDGIALRDADGRKVGALRFLGEAGAVRIIVEGTLPPEVSVHPDDVAHFAQVANESAVNAVWPSRRGAALSGALAEMDPAPA